MNPAELKALLECLVSTWENEVVEFKLATNDYDTDKIGEYFSALSNEANLRGLDRAWLVFGINVKSRAVFRTNYRLEPECLHMGLQKEFGKKIKVFRKNLVTCQ